MDGWCTRDGFISEVGERPPCAHLFLFFLFLYLLNSVLKQNLPPIGCFHWSSEMLTQMHVCVCVWNIMEILFDHFTPAILNIYLWYTREQSKVEQCPASEENEEKCMYVCAWEEEEGYDEGWRGMTTCGEPASKWEHNNNIREQGEGLSARWQQY